ncbi:MAG: DesA/ISL3 alpha bundle tail domain-containing protein [Endozoicomonas sp.]
MTGIHTFWPREESLLAHQHHEAIDRILEASHTLKTIYQKKKELQAIWLNRKGL